MHSRTLLTAGVAATLKSTSLAPLIEFVQSIQDQSTKMALTQIARDHEERLKLIEGESGRGCSPCVDFMRAIHNGIVYTFVYDCFAFTSV